MERALDFEYEATHVGAGWYLSEKLFHDTTIALLSLIVGAIMGRLIGGRGMPWWLVTGLLLGAAAVAHSNGEAKKTLQSGDIDLVRAEVGDTNVYSDAWSPPNPGGSPSCSCVPSHEDKLR